MKNRESEVKIKISKTRNQKSLKDLSGPRMDDIHKKSSRWKKLPVKNIVKIKDKTQPGNSHNRKLLRVLLIVLLFLAAVSIVFGYWRSQDSLIQDRMVKMIPYEASLYGNFKADKLMKFSNNDEQTALGQRMDFVGNYLINLYNNELANYGLDFSKDIMPQLGGDFSFGYVGDADNPGFVFLFETMETEGLKNTIETTRHKTRLNEESYENETIYILSADEKDALYLAFIDNYLAVSKKRSGIAAAIDTSGGKRLSLAQNEEYKKARPWYLFNEIGYFYAKPEIIGSLTGAENHISETFKALTHRAEGMFLLIKEKSGGLLLSLKIDGENYQFAGSVDKKLIDLLPANTSGFIAGNNLSQDWQGLRQDISESSPALEFYFVDFLRRFEESARVNNEDLLKFFENNFLISFDYTGDKINYNLITKFPDNQTAIAGMEAFEDAASNYLGNQYPKKQKMILSDGTEAAELLPDPESYQFSDLNFEGKIARAVASESLEYDFSYVVDDNIAIISTSLGSLKNIISATSDTDKLAKKRYFNYPYSRAYQSASNNILFLDNNDLQDYFKFNNIFGKILSVFDNIVLSVRTGNGTMHIKSFLYLE